MTEPEIVEAPIVMAIVGFDGDLIPYALWTDGSWHGPCPRCVSNLKDWGLEHNEAIAQAHQVRIKGELVKVSDPHKSDVPSVRKMADDLGEWVLKARVQLLHVGCCEAGISNNHWTRR